VKAAFVGGFIRYFRGLVERADAFGLVNAVAGAVYQAHFATSLKP